MYLGGLLKQKCSYNDFFWQMVSSSCSCYCFSSILNRALYIVAKVVSEKTDGTFGLARSDRENVTCAWRSHAFQGPRSNGEHWIGPGQNFRTVSFFSVCNFSRAPPALIGATIQRLGDPVPWVHMGLGAPNIFPGLDVPVSFSSCPVGVCSMLTASFSSCLVGVCSMLTAGDQA